MYLWVLMMSEFYESVNRFREAMRARIAAELEEPELRAGRPAMVAAGESVFASRG
jgi:hypothetical protein